ncbi:unnamed protein product [Ixodes pacificus]
MFICPSASNAPKPLLGLTVNLATLKHLSTISLTRSSSIPGSCQHMSLKKPKGICRKTLAANGPFKCQQYPMRLVGFLVCWAIEIVHTEPDYLALLLSLLSKCHRLSSL